MSITNNTTFHGTHSMSGHGTHPTAGDGTHSMTGHGTHSMGNDHSKTMGGHNIPEDHSTRGHLVRCVIRYLKSSSTTRGQFRPATSRLVHSTRSELELQRPVYSGQC